MLFKKLEWVALCCLWLPGLQVSGQTFVNWESPHVSPLDLTPAGELLLAVNTPDNRLEVFFVDEVGVTSLGAIPVGLEPVSVRCRSDSEAWVVNHVSDSVSIVDLEAMHVVATLPTGDEPADVVFAGDPPRAFVSVSQLNTVLVFDPDNLGAPLATIPIEGEDPRALTTDGTHVYAAIFESGNRTTVIDYAKASLPAVNPYPGDPNPPPNLGNQFFPPIADGLPAPPPVGVIVKRDAAAAWRDDNGYDWSNGVTWDVHDHDVAIIDTASLQVDYATNLMNLNMAIAARPGGGVIVVGTDAANHVRFEPNLRGRFVQVKAAAVLGPGEAAAVFDLNPHLDYQSSTVDQFLREESLGDPRGVAWDSSGERVFVTGMGSNNLIVLDTNGRRVERIDVGQGPTGVRIDERHHRVYVLNRFDGTISSIEANSDVEETAFFDPTPEVIRLGRPLLYDTHHTSGLGHASCASCHVDGRMDQLVWDLGDPQGEMKPFNQTCLLGDSCQDWHPMKGPMATQTLLGIIGTEPIHWRGDRENLAAFSPAFVSLLGLDSEPTRAEMELFEEFVATLAVPPNPYRNLDGTLPSRWVNGGNPQVGEELFHTGLLDDPFNCVDCHAGSAGTVGLHQNKPNLSTTLKVPQLRNLYEKTGRQNSNRGFGFVHDGIFDSLFSFLRFDGIDNDQQRLDVEAFLFCFSTDQHPGIGAQVSLPDRSGGRAPGIDRLRRIAATGMVGMVAKGLINGERRGYYLLNERTFQSDRRSERISTSALVAAASLGNEITFTLVPAGSQIRIGVDRDADGVFDGDETEQRSPPSLALDLPPGVSP